MPVLLACLAFKGGDLLQGDGEAQPRDRHLFPPCGEEEALRWSLEGDKRVVALVCGFRSLIRGLEQAFRRV